MAPAPKSLKWLALAVVLAGAGIWLFKAKRSSEPVAAETDVPLRQERAVVDGPGRAWNDLIERIDQGASAEEIKQALAETKTKWCEEDPRVIADKIAILLRDGQDRETGLAFVTGHGGGLQSWPSLRVFLLDVLMSTDPDVAVEIAREVLAETDSAEEFAVAMRALVMEKPWRAGNDELHAHLSTLLGREDWQAEGRAGFAEGMDLVREIGTAEAFQSLAEWVDGSPSFEEAGEMALHEFSAEYSDKMAERLGENPELLDGDAGLRAGLMARIDPADPIQLESAESYLVSSKVGLEEKRDFLRLFPLRSSTTGFRLYAGTPVPYDLERVKASDTAAAQAVEAWLGRSDLDSLSEDLTALQGRLEQWKKQAEEAEDQ